MPSQEKYILELSRDEMRSLKDAVEYLDTNHQWLTDMSYGENLPAVYAKVYFNIKNHVLWAWSEFLWLCLEMLIDVFYTRSCSATSS